MTINLKKPDLTELKPRIVVFGVGGAGGNAVNNMISSGLSGVEFVVANTDAQALASSKAEQVMQMGVAVTEGLGAGSQPEVGRAAAEEVIDEINDHLSGAHMVFITAGMGGGTGTGAAPVIARAAREHGILTVGVVTKPFQFEGQRRMRIAEAGITELQKVVDTLIVIPNQNLFRIANDRTTFADAFAMADQVLYSGVAGITDLMVKEGLINLDFADVRSIMRGMGKAMMGTGEASGEGRALSAAEAAIANPLLDEVSMKGAQGLLISITGGRDMTLFEVDEAATRIREEVDADAMIILGATFDDSLEGLIRVSVVATGIDQALQQQPAPATETKVADLTERLRSIRAAAAAPAAGEVRPARVAAAEPMVAAAPAPQPAPVRAEPIAAAAQHQAAVAAAAPISAISEAAAVEAAQAYPAQPAPRPQARVRMPRIEDFNPVAQRQLRGQQAGDEDKRPVGLLRRLAQVGLGRQQEPAPVQREPRLAPAPRQRPPQQRPAQAGQPHPQGQPQMMHPQQPAAGHAPQAYAEAPVSALPPQPQLQAPVARPQAPPVAAQRPQSEFAKKPQPRMPQDGGYRPAQGQLDPHGRPAPQPRPALDDDHLEIPAFLRRQAN